jgi:SAM-dependent methyltransferase
MATSTASPAQATPEAPAVDYEKAWEKFWETVSDDPQDVLWNVSHQEAVVKDWEHMKPFFSHDLPLVDVGCGDGTQTEFFSDHFHRVVGVDVSAAAITIAKEKHAANSSIEYQVLDLLDAGATREFRNKMGGDVNIYVRGVLMQFSPQDRITAANNLKVLVGAQGYLYLHEYLPQTKEYYGKLFQTLGGMPNGFKRVVECGIKPGGIAREEMEVMFPPKHYEVLKICNDHVMSTLISIGKEEDVAHAPGFFVILRKQDAAIIN